MKLGWDAVTWERGSHVGALGPSAQAPAAASEGLWSPAGPLCQLPVPGRYFRDTGSFGGTTGYLWSDSGALPENLRIQVSNSIRLVPPSVICHVLQFLMLLSCQRQHKSG